MNRFQRAREMAGFTQKELSEKIGVKPPIISRYEDEGEKRIIPPLNRINMISDVCGVPVSFLTDPIPLKPLTDEQADRFRNELRVRNEVFQKWQDETEASYGTKHPFLYMLKDRWVFTEYDVHYVCDRYGMDELLILNTELPSESDINARIKETMYRDKNGNIIVKSTADSFEAIRSYLFSHGYLVNDTDAKLFEECGVKVISEDNGKHLYLNIDNVDPEAIRAIIVLIKQAQKYHDEQLPRPKNKPPQDTEDPETAENSIQK